MDGVKTKCSLLLFVLMLSALAAAFAQSPASRPAITGIAHVSFFADDLAKSEAFYATLLGWDKVPAAGIQPGVRFYANHLQYVELLTPPQKGQVHRLDSVAFLISNAEQLRSYLGAHGLAVPGTVSVDKDGSRTFLVHDPEGNKVEFTQPGPHSPPVPKNASESLSNHIMHAGYEVHDRAALDHFYKDLLGFHLYWQGAAKEGNPPEWVMMQVPNGTDWIEYMLYLGKNPSREALGSADHIAPGVVSVAELQRRLEARGWKAPDGKDPKVLGVDGKLQLDLHDPDGTRIEFMEFAPVQKACCSPYTGVQPKPTPGW
jgi:catechol 2,3-dioxygenase-like lactoylglutathione lyase family enzyme